MIITLFFSPFSHRRDNGEYGAHHHAQIGNGAQVLWVFVHRCPEPRLGLLEVSATECTCSCIKCGLPVARKPAPASAIQPRAQTQMPTTGTHQQQNQNQNQNKKNRGAEVWGAKFGKPTIALNLDP